MSAVLHSRKGKSKPISTSTLWLVLGLAVLFFIVQYGQQLLLEHDLKAKSAQQRVLNATLRDENLRLKASLEYYQSDKYVEQRAREDLNLRRHDEEVLIPVGVTAEAEQEAAGGLLDPAKTATGTARLPEERPNWLRWFDLFSYGPSSP